MSKTYKLNTKPNCVGLGLFLFGLSMFSHHNDARESLIIFIFTLSLTIVYSIANQILMSTCSNRQIKNAFMWSLAIMVILYSYMIYQGDFYHIFTIPFSVWFSMTLTLLFSGVRHENL